MSLTIDQLTADLTTLFADRDLQTIPFHKRDQPSYEFQRGGQGERMDMVLLDNQRCAYGSIEIERQQQGFGMNPPWNVSTTPEPLHRGVVELMHATVDRSDHREACLAMLSVLDYLDRLNPTLSVCSSEIHQDVMAWQLHVTLGEFVVSLKLDLLTEAPRVLDLGLDCEHYFTPRYWMTNVVGLGASLVCKIEDEWVPTLTYRVVPGVDVGQPRLKIGVDVFIPKLLGKDSAISAPFAIQLLEEMRHQFVGMEYVSVNAQPSPRPNSPMLVVAGYNPYTKVRYEFIFEPNAAANRFAMGSQPMMPRHHY